MPLCRHGHGEPIGVTVSMLVSSKGVDDHDSCASLAEASNNGKGS